MKVLPEEMTQDLQDLPNLLNKLGDLSVFQNNPEHVQKMVLSHALGDKSPLVAAIMERVKVSAGGPASYVDKALNYELPPSTQLNHVDVVRVLNPIFGQIFVDLRGLCDYFDTHLSTTSSTSTSTSSFSWSPDAFSALYRNTLYLGDKEASAGGILAVFMELVRDALEKRHPNKIFYVDLQLKFLRFCSDAAKIVATTRLEKIDVVFSLEYKLKVAAKLNIQPAFHLSELFLQAFYLATQYGHTIVHCLTDLTNYHIFLMGMDGKKLCIKKYWYRE